MNVPPVDLSLKADACPHAAWVMGPAGEGGTMRIGLLEPKAGAIPGGTFQIPTGQELLAGPALECLLLGEAPARKVGPVTFWESGDSLAGYVRQPAGPETLESVTELLYTQILGTLDGRSLCRVWNFVPGIIHTRPGQLENYKLFCSGRDSAFTRHYGSSKSSQFSAASATGADDGHLTILFLATSSGVDSWENPDQTPAWAYPESFGPRPPSFARASRIRDALNRDWFFVSGTAAIKGHATQYPGDFRRQMAVVFDNLSIIMERAGLSLCQACSGQRRHFKVFLKQADYLEGIQRSLQQVLNRGDTIQIVRADICRSDLELEIEVTVAPSDVPCRVDTGAGEDRLA